MKQQQIKNNVAQLVHSPLKNKRLLSPAAPEIRKLAQKTIQTPELQKYWPDRNEDIPTRKLFNLSPKMTNIQNTSLYEQCKTDIKDKYKLNTVDIGNSVDFLSNRVRNINPKLYELKKQKPTITNKLKAYVAIQQLQLQQQQMAGCSGSTLANTSLQASINKAKVYATEGGNNKGRRNTPLNRDTNDELICQSLRMPLTPKERINKQRPKQTKIENKKPEHEGGRRGSKMEEHRRVVEVFVNGQGLHQRKWTEADGDADDGESVDRTINETESAFYQNQRENEMQYSIDDFSLSFCHNNSSSKNNRSEATQARINNTIIDTILKKDNGKQVSAQVSQASQSNGEDIFIVLDANQLKNNTALANNLKLDETSRINQRNETLQLNNDTSRRNQVFTPNETNLNSRMSSIENWHTNDIRQLLDIPISNDIRQKSKFASKLPRQSDQYSRQPSEQSRSPLLMTSHDSRSKQNRFIRTGTAQAEPKFIKPIEQYEEIINKRSKFLQSSCDNPRQIERMLKKDQIMLSNISNSKNNLLSEQSNTLNLSQYTDKQVTDILQEQREKGVSSPLLNFLKKESRRHTQWSSDSFQQLKPQPAKKVQFQNSDDLRSISPKQKFIIKKQKDMVINQFAQSLDFKQNGLPQLLEYKPKQNQILIQKNKQKEQEMCIIEQKAEDQDESEELIFECDAKLSKEQEIQNYINFFKEKLKKQKQKTKKDKMTHQQIQDLFGFIDNLIVEGENKNRQEQEAEQS